MLSEKNKDILRYFFLIFLFSLVAFLLYEYAYIREVKLIKLAKCTALHEPDSKWECVKGKDLQKKTSPPGSDPNEFYYDFGYFSKSIIQCPEDINVEKNGVYFLCFGCEIGELIVYKTNIHYSKTSYMGPISIKLMESGESRSVYIYSGDLYVMEKN